MSPDDVESRGPTVDQSEFVEVNASGHVQEVERQFGLVSISAVGIITGCSWPLTGGILVVSILNGGSPGVLYEFIAVSLMYCLVAASVAEMASAIPSSAGVYQWAAVFTSKAYGRVVSFYAGWWNVSAWIFATVSTSSVVAQQLVQMYALFHADYIFQRWHVFVTYLIISWTACFVVVLGNRLLPVLNDIGLVFIVAGGLASIIVCAVMPSQTGSGYADDAFVWKDWINSTGWSSDGLTFLLGMLNGAYAMGTPDSVSHLAEEIPRPSVNIPKAIGMQMIFGFASTFCYLVALMYSISDLDEVLTGGGNFPLAQIYLQATGTRAGAMGLLLVVFLPSVSSVIAAYITAGRTMWTLGRDGATPCHQFVGKIHPTMHNPVNATILCACVNTCFGAIYVGSATAFNAFVGSFVILTTLSYLAALLPYLEGPIVIAAASVYMVVFIVIFSLPYTMPVTSGTMNYSSVIAGGITIAVTALWFWKRGRGYEGPKTDVDVLTGGTATNDPGAMDDPVVAHGTEDKQTH
ncbi:Choline transport protein [Cyphellophora attinorum]|uniref:Choline transport protein n=1 Tax=Cyphellophora attinorum TaxID=1664694 RepID=A0A0N1HFA6_9EURO|nr:Choline transport protein [Phialophora attinorum]KPI43937.1 Choline transport protein [Phialophora attinorum]